MIDQRANIHPDATIGDNVTIDAFATVYGNTVIGEGTWIGPNAVVMEGARIGKNCKIFPGAVISAIPQDLKFNGEETIVEIGENTTIREFVTINRGTKAKSITKIGANCLLMSYVHVAHDCFVADNCILTSYSALAGEVEMGEWAILGGKAAVHQFVKIGPHAYIGGGALVRKDIPPYIIVANEPLSYAGVNSVGLRRRNFTNEKINEIQQVYRYFFQRGLNNTQAIEMIRKEMESTPEIEEIIDFITQSERGIIRGPQD
jgi:UDP-N-acetylglucosamine acyltransferase